ncbi:hypothetical protein [Nocardioides sp.]|uniref:hypothetical protein n=1 Tax=Nocardioides sp. TaxID=35761 RepID=UPI00286AC0D7|nr:hypothetical protein [Nocardioides sp.]
MSEPQDPSGPQEPVGSVGEEAAKLLGAFSDWAKDHGADVGVGLGGLAGAAAASLQDVNEHLATGSAECTYCPLCRTVHAVRQTSPEVRAHLATAAAALMQAAAGLMATPVPPEARGRGVEQIDLDDTEDPHDPNDLDGQS